MSRYRGKGDADMPFEEVLDEDVCIQALSSFLPVLFRHIACLLPHLFRLIAQNAAQRATPPMWNA